MPAPFPTDALDIFTTWLRTGKVPDTFALVSAALAIGQWVVGEIGGDADEGLKGAPTPHMSKSQVADALEAQANAPDGLKGAFPWLLVLRLVAEAIQAAVAKS